MVIPPELYQFLIGRQREAISGDVLTEDNILSISKFQTLLTALIGSVRKNICLNTTFDFAERVHNTIPITPETHHHFRIQARFE